MARDRDGSLLYHALLMLQSVLRIPFGFVSQEFYEQTSKQRKLTWQLQLGQCHVKANFDAKSIELILQPTQAALLMLFNAGAEIDLLRCLPCLGLHAEDSCQP